MKKTFYWTLILSLLLHFSQYLVLKRIPTSFPKTSVIETEIIETEAPQKEQKLEKPIIKTENTEPNLNDLNQPAAFFSDKTQRVQKQTRTQNLGYLQNKNSAPRNNSPQPVDKGEGLEFNRALQNSLREHKESQFHVQLPQDINLADVTNLNTDAHIFGSFYNRVTEMFYIRWTQNLEIIWSRLSLETKKDLAGRAWRTELEIVLDSEGHVINAMVMKLSGFPPFDQAGTLAFRQAAFFPNPPQEKVEPDGKIRLKYRIAVHIQ